LGVLLVLVIWWFVGYVVCFGVLLTWFTVRGCFGCGLFVVWVLGV